TEASVGENYQAEAGFVRRKGYNLLSPVAGFLWIPNKRIISHGPRLDANYFYNMDYARVDHDFTISYQFEFKDRSTLSFGIKDFYTRLDKDFDPTHSRDTVLLKGTEYSTNMGYVQYRSDTRRLFNFGTSLYKGGFFNGNITTVEGQLVFRYQPYMNLSFNFSYNDIRLPFPFQQADFWLLGPKLDLTLSEKVFFSTYVQYNEQMKNTNINMRFQWRYKPVSDLFVVYTDNYFTESWNRKNRALVLKLSFWFN
ncbi:MAG TPA: hypothetical protein VFG54_12420, partial [Prolixibacteraceae bacterium]|nr:hypothetical protein [Prolixibacteraceae bacterium]